MAQQSQLVTADELARIPEDGDRYELVRGRVIRMSPPGFRHGQIAARLAGLLHVYLGRFDSGAVVTESGFRLASNPDTVRAPDVAVVRRERLGAEPPAGFWNGPPDLAVEVVSPGDSASEVAVTVADYVDAGTPLVWVVLPERRSVSVHRPRTAVVTLGPDDKLDGADILPGFECTVGDIFA